MNAKTIENMLHPTFDLPQDQLNDDPKHLFFPKISNICFSPTAMTMNQIQNLLYIFTLIL